MRSINQIITAMAAALWPNDGRRYAHRANRHNANRPGPGGKNFMSPWGGRWFGKGGARPRGYDNPWRAGGWDFYSHAVYPHSSKRQQARYKRQIEAGQIRNAVCVKL